MSSIRLHSKYGLNPTIPLCFWCGKERNEVAMLGAAYKGEAPMHMCLDYQPCDACKANMALGITLMEATEESGSAKPTGRWLVVAEDAVSRWFQPESVVAAVLRARKAHVDTEAFAMMMRSMEEQKES